MSQTLRERLIARIRAEGPLTVAQYMELALWDRAAGYYATRDPLGSGGDFTTSPEISQIFGELIGAWFADYWQGMGAPDPVMLCELGPGRGTLMADLLRAAAAMPAFHRAIRLHLVERSPALRARQAEALGAARPVWHESAAALPDLPLLLVANEFLDALPVRQFERSADGWHERRIGLDPRGALAFQPDPLAAADFTRPFPVGSVAELCPAAGELARKLGARLERRGGAALFVDYGYDAAAPGDSFQAVSRHRFADPLKDPGESDLTAHVDFAAFAAAAESSGARAWGPVTQGRFLAALGLTARVETLARNQPAPAVEAIRQAARRLIEPAQMGNLFRALALTRKDAPPPAGFTA